MGTEEIIRSAIRNPTPEAAGQIFSDVTTPDIVKTIMPGIVEKLDSGVSSEQLANETLGKVLDVVEDEVLGNGVDFILENFGDRIVELLTNNISSIAERVVGLLVGTV